MKNRIFNKMFTFCIIATMLFFSCSSDDDSNNDNNTENNDNTGGNNNIGNFVALPATDLGNYEGSFFSTTEGEEEIGGGEAVATLINSGGNVYRVDFNVDIPDVSDLQFVLAPPPTTPNTFTTIEDINRAGTGAVLIDIEGGIRTLTVTIIMDKTTIVFSGRKAEDGM